MKPLSTDEKSRILLDMGFTPRRDGDLHLDDRFHKVGASTTSAIIFLEFNVKY